MKDSAIEQYSEDAETLELKEATKRLSAALQAYIKPRKDAFGALV